VLCWCIFGVGRSPIYRGWRASGLDSEGKVEETTSNIHTQAAALKVHKAVLNIRKCLQRTKGRILFGGERLQRSNSKQTTHVQGSGRYTLAEKISAKLELLRFNCFSICPFLVCNTSVFTTIPQILQNVKEERK